MWVLLFSAAPAVAQSNARQQPPTQGPTFRTQTQAPKGQTNSSRQEAYKLAAEAFSLRQQGRPLGALAKYLQAMAKLSNPNATLLYTIGEIYESIGDLDNAERQYEKAAEAKISSGAQSGKSNDTQIEDRQRAKASLARIRGKPLVQFDFSVAPRDLRVVINNVDVTSSALHRPLRRDPGIYFIDAIAGGRWTRLGPIDLKPFQTYSVTIGEDAHGVTLTSNFGTRSSRAISLPGCDRPLETNEDTPSSAGAASTVFPLDARAPSEAEIAQTQPASADPSTGVVVSRTVGLVGLGLGTFSSFAWLGNTLADQRNPANTVLGVATVALLAAGAGAGLVWITLGKREESQENPAVSLGVAPGSLAFKSTF